MPGRSKQAQAHIFHLYSTMSERKVRSSLRPSVPCLEELDGLLRSDKQKKKKRSDKHKVS